MLVAHGIGTRADLPIPVVYAAIGAGVAVGVSFVALTAFWRTPRLSVAMAGRPLPTAIQRAADSRPVRLALQSVMLAVGIVVYLVGLTGPDDVTRNLAPWALFITFWVGLVPLSLLFGPVWRVINPLRAAHAGLCAFLRWDRDGLQRYPQRWGYWPAVVWLGAFAWFELVFPDRARPIWTATFLLVYAVVNTGMAVVYGRAWFSRGDGFEVYSSLLGALAPLGRRGDRRLVARNPLRGVDAVPLRPGLIGVVVVLVGSTAYDGLSRTTWYVTHMAETTANATGMLAASVTAVGVIYLAGTVYSARVGARLGVDAGPTAFAHSIVPIAAAYAIAHYFSLFLFDGQMTFILASDPWSSGLDLYGLSGHRINYTAVSTRVISLVQISAIVIGHVVAVAVAHDRAIRLMPYRDAVRTQVPLLVSMVGLTLIAVWLVLAG